jgi:hypothetical protein
LLVAAIPHFGDPAVDHAEDLHTADVGLRAVPGISDGSVQPNVDVKRAVNDISSAVYGIAYLWLVLSDGYDLKNELKCLRARLIRDYGSTAN